MRATKGFTKMDRKTLFELFDRNGKIYFCNVTRSLMVQGLSSLFPGQVKHIHFFLGDKFIGVDEFRSVPQSIRSAGILDHCLREKLVKRVCIGIGWGSRLQSNEPSAQLNELNAQDLGKLTIGAQPSIAE